MKYDTFSINKLVGCLDPKGIIHPFEDGIARQLHKEQIFIDILQYKVAKES